PARALERLHGFLRHGGPDNESGLVFLLRHLAGLGPEDGRLPEPVPPAGILRRAPDDGRPRAGIVLYRSHVLAGDLAPFEALADALEARGLAADLLFASSLKDEKAAEWLSRHLDETRPAVLLNATFFSARDGSSGGTVLDRAGVPVLQLLQPGIAEESWREDGRGIGQADLAMQVVLPELDGRLSTCPISFKIEPDGSGFAPRRNGAWAPGISLAADRAAGWARLSAAPREQRRIVICLSDYPGVGGQAGHAVGLDSFGSLAAILGGLRDAGYDTGDEPIPEPAALARALLDPSDAATARPGTGLEADAYRALFATLPDATRAGIAGAWGSPAAVPHRFAILRFGRVSVSVQPDRGPAAQRRAEYHDPALPPCHRYVAFHLWLREVERAHVLVQLGAHGTAEWLPGKSGAPGPDCVPSALLRGLPVVYPFICNDPGEAAAAKRRLGAVVVGHLPPPMREGGLHGEALALERLVDEYAAADGLDGRRNILLRDEILERATRCGVLNECGAHRDANEGVARISAWLCDVKELQIRDGLHVFGRAPTHEGELLDAVLRGAPGTARERIAAALRDSPQREMDALLAALDGGFVPAGPAGAPTRNRPDVLPTGRNPFGVDPRALPTRSATILAGKAARTLLLRHEQERGEPLRSVVIDLWGSTSLRTGGEDLALALILLGTEPEWDGESGRLAGFTVLPLATLDRPRVDVTLRISGFFRDGFPAQIALFDQAVRAVAERDEDGEWNGLAARRCAGDPGARIYGAAPGGYGAGIEEMLARGDWSGREELGRSYLHAGGWSYGAAGDGVRDPDGFAARIGGADALVHIQDHAETDALESLDLPAHVGGFAAAAALLGGTPDVWYADSSRADDLRIRPVRDQVALVVRGRAANPDWIAGMMRHGARGAAEIARTADALHGYAATLPEREHGRFDAQFELLFAATLGDDRVESFLREENPAAREAMAARFREAAERGLWRPRSNGAALEATP
ncbi:MAG: cobaltochelatase subunit CobN, partial [Gluconacetobacter diazotrophicus]|nr:cobaltochelatase subunit CobN [Gluconacetobacter diazotrophicus]